jgi:hypothetical protein
MNRANIERSQRPGEFCHAPSATLLLVQDKLFHLGYRRMMIWVGLPVGGVLQPEAKQCIWRMVADVPQAIEAVRRLYFDRKLAQQLGANGRTFVRQFAIESQVAAWHRSFGQLAQPLAEPAKAAG